MIGLIGAMAMEVRGLIERLSDAREVRTPSGAYHVGRLRGVEVVIAHSGIGKVFSALRVQETLTLFAPKAVIGVGVAGALTNQLRVADAVIATHCVQHDMDTTAVGDPIGMISGINLVRLPCDEGLRAMLRRAADAEGVRFLERGIATGDLFIADLASKEAVRETFDAVVCDMETGAAAQVCYVNGTPFAALRAVSDEMGMNGEDYERHKHMAADTAQRVVLRLMDAMKGSEYDG